MLFAAVLLLGMRMRGIGSEPPGRQRVRDWALFGLLWGGISMVPIPRSCCWRLCRDFGFSSPRKYEIGLGRGVALALLSAAVCTVVAMPWVVRNERFFMPSFPHAEISAQRRPWPGHPIPKAFPGEQTVPTVEQAPEHRLYAQMGELAYVRMRGQMAKQWARANPVHFWRLVALRFYMFWASVPHTAGGHPAAETVREVAYCFGSITGILGLLLGASAQASRCQPLCLGGAIATDRLLFCKCRVPFS